MSKNSDGSYTYHDKSTGNISTVNKDGTSEVTDGYGNAVKDSNGDGKPDKYSTDSGKTWSNLK